MDQPDLKALKKLADLCRKAGIKHYKSDKFEFTLSEDVPVSNYKRQKAISKPTSTPDSPFVSDTLSEQELLFWSVGSPSDSHVDGE